MSRWAQRLAILVVVVSGMGGCLANEEPTQQERTQTETQTNENVGCSVQHEGGSIGPGRSLSVGAVAEVAPATIVISFEASPYVGTVDLQLDRDGAEVWSDQVSGAGNTDYTTELTGVEAGTYTLTATGEQAVGTATLGLAIGWGGEPCP